MIVVMVRADLAGGVTFPALPRRVAMRAVLPCAVMLGAFTGRGIARALLAAASAAAVPEPGRRGIGGDAAPFAVVHAVPVSPAVLAAHQGGDVSRAVLPASGVGFELRPVDVADHRPFVPLRASGFTDVVDPPGGLLGDLVLADALMGLAVVVGPGPGSVEVLDDASGSLAGWRPCGTLRCVLGASVRWMPRWRCRARCPCSSPCAARRRVSRRPRPWP